MYIAGMSITAEILLVDHSASESLLIIPTSSASRSLRLPEFASSRTLNMLLTAIVHTVPSSTLQSCSKGFSKNLALVIPPT